MDIFRQQTLDRSSPTNHGLTYKLEEETVMIGEIRQFKGLPVSSGIYEGNVKVLRSNADFDKVCEGDIIVVYASSPAWTVPLLKAGALIAEVGGILCHTAIIAREIGVPGIVNIENITNILEDGDRITVNGEAGEINVLS